MGKKEALNGTVMNSEIMHRLWIYTILKRFLNGEISNLLHFTSMTYSMTTSCSCTFLRAPHRVHDSCGSAGTCSTIRPLKNLCRHIVYVEFQQNNNRRSASFLKHKLSVLRFIHEENTEVHYLYRSSSIQCI